jgi:hypothetical protein
LLDNLKAFGQGKLRNGLALGLQTKAATALFLGAYAVVSNCGRCHF